MASRMKEDEKNEKIIRGLLKLPHNKRCINCNSLGPQYVCTNFWTFVCTNCSGIHREFTHRVKSVSMAKFTSQEVGALQRGGNQVAKETYLKDFDPQRHQLPDSNNVDRLRDFIRHVYVERRYSGDRPPRGKAGERDDAPESRRADFYRSASCSPPYEDNRRFGERTGYGVRKYEYDRSRYDERVYTSDERRSPGHYEYDKGRYDRPSQDNRRYDDAYKRSPGFESDGNQPRKFEERHFPETPDRRWSGERSPNYQKDYDITSPPPVRPVREILGDDVPTLRVGDVPRANGNRESDGSVRSLTETRREFRNQRTASSSSMGSVEGTSPTTVQSTNSASLIDFNTEADPPVTFQKDSSGVTLTNPSATMVQDPFVSSLSRQSSDTPQQDPFAASLPKQPSNTGSQDFFAASLSGQQSSSTTASGGNGGWATFDFAPQSTPVQASVQPPVPLSASQVRPSGASSDNNWSAFSQPPATSATSGSQSWSDVLPTTTSPPSGVSQNTQPSVSVPKPPLPRSEGQKSQPSAGNAQNGRKEIPEDLFTSLYPDPAQNMRIPFGPQYGYVTGVHYPAQAVAMPGAVQYLQRTSKSTNPFDTGSDTPVSHPGSFLNMGSLQAALPNFAAPSTAPGTSSGSHTAPWMVQSTPMAFQPTAISGSYTNQAPGSVPFNVQSGANAANTLPSTSLTGDDLFNNLGTSHLPKQNTLPSLSGNPFG
eukprot:TRINITY_DN746_c0_g1_i1.p1 TRINITY_DN746_c0_g1~~TRINITY_DN746_c0_g1_i1.p1  ORF type:complete len:710 (-),score=167.14 TRINITY_DN746_c0_g1_i1:630-2759(-)